jgi:hypothetical protein
MCYCARSSEFGVSESILNRQNITVILTFQKDFVGAIYVTSNHHPTGP